MALDFKELKKLAEGKTKIICENPGDPKTVLMVFKDDITAGDGVKHDVMQGKALVDWETNRNIFEYLNRKGVRTHYVSSPQEKVSVVKKLDFKINLEVVSRRVAAGSILKWSRAAEGDWYDPPATQFHYKDDPLHDPMLDESYIDFIVRNKQGGEWYAAMRYDWSISTGAYGKWLKKFLPPQVWALYIRTYPGAEYADIWDALFAVCRLTRQIGPELAQHLGYRYAMEDDRRVVAYLEHVRALPHSAVDFEDR